jgi:mono/diheme cytochrome c family protein
MMFARLGKLVSWSWRKLLVAIALWPLMGFSLGSYLAYENTGPPEIAAAAADVQRGRLLYETYCIACHTTQAHWRDKHIVRSWADLLYQVTRMQKNAGQDWSSNEIGDVAAYLNEIFYKMPCPSAGCQGPEAGVDERTVLARGR